MLYRFISENTLAYVLTSVIQENVLTQFATLNSGHDDRGETNDNTNHCNCMAHFFYDYNKPEIKFMHGSNDSEYHRNN
jgi:hypothetical protein